MSNMKNICVIAGARPNFMKIAPLMRQFERVKGFRVYLIHTGQHYDRQMSDVFFQDLNIKKPDVNLGVGSGTHARQTAQIMQRFEDTLEKFPKMDLLIVVGDVNSTLACSLVASKRQIRIAHVEAGLRSYDRTMPEEINRVLTDALSDFLFTPSKDADENLRKEGVDRKKIFRVGNIMIDSLREAETKIAALDFRVPDSDYAVLTLHRPHNVDSKTTMKELFRTLIGISSRIPIFFPCHPRTFGALSSNGLQKNLKNLRILEPLGYLPFLKLMRHARLVFTDSGGIQEETTIMNIPCLTLRENTERPVTVLKGTNIIVGRDPERIRNETFSILNGKKIRASSIPLWDGKTALRIVDVITQEI